MAITWLKESDAEREFKDTLVEWHLAYNYKGCYSPAETAKYVLSFFSQGQKQSPTARQLYEFVLLHPKRIYVVGMRGGFQCFDSTAGEKKDMPVIFIDVDGKLEIFVRAPHGLTLSTKREEWMVAAETSLGRKGAGAAIKPRLDSANTILMEDPNQVLAQSKLAAARVASGASKAYDYALGNRVSLDNRIAALHEFGHAKQWLERPMLFDQQKKAAPGYSTESIERSLKSAVKAERIGQVNLARRDAALKLGGAQQDVRLTSSRAGFAKDIQERAEKYWTKRGMGTADLGVRTAEDVAAFEAALKKAPVWGRAIEMDNMERHEWPICRELGIPIRTNYRDLDATTTAQASLTTQIARLAEKKKHELAQAEARQEAERQRVLAESGTGKATLTCPKCGMSNKPQAHVAVCPGRVAAPAKVQPVKFTLPPPPPKTQ